MAVKKRQEKKKPERTDIDILFSSKEVEGYTIRPFSLGDIEKLTPLFKKVAIKYLESGNDPDLSKLSGDMLKSILLGLDFLPEVVELLSIYLGEEKETIRNFDIDKVQKITFVLIGKNAEYLKNLFRLVTATLRQFTGKST